MFEYEPLHVNYFRVEVTLMLEAFVLNQGPQTQIAPRDK